MGLILLVSEDLVEIDTVKAALSVHGWWVTVAADRQVALQVAADQAPKLVLVDNDLPDAIELLRSFGAVNGGPGAVALVDPDFEGTLELKEAGADELLSKPAAPPAVLEAVHRCLAAPRPGPAERRARSDRLLTTEEIFGDVLREIGEDGARAAAGARTAAPETPAEPAAAASNDLFAAPPVAERTASLEGLFDDQPDADVAPIAAPTEQPAAAGPADASAGEWRGEERRSADRPWSSDRRDAPALSDPVPPAEAATDEADTVVTSVAGASTEPATPAAETREFEGSEELEGAAPPAPAEPARARRTPRAALVAGSLAATLIVAGGAVLVLNPGAGPADRAPAAATRTEAPEAPVGAETQVEPAALLPPPARAVEAPAGPAPPIEPSGEIVEVDIEAIVDQELERREEALRRVFLEEEKRLLRELNNIDRDGSEADDGTESDADGPPGAGLEH